MSVSDPSAPAALVVDDVLLNRVVLAVALRQLGYKVTQAVEGGEALRRLEETRFEVVFLDWDLPGLNGDEVAARILAKPDAPPIIAITADDSLEMRERCRRAGVAGHLGKAFNNEGLRNLLREVLSAPPRRPATGATLDPAVGESATRKLLLGRSREQFTAERGKLAQALADGRKDAALRALHNLVSLSGMVGALSVHAAAKATEDRLRLGQDYSRDLAALDASLGNFRPPAA